MKGLIIFMIYILIKEIPAFRVFYEWGICGETPEDMKLIYLKENVTDGKQLDNSFQVVVNGKLISKFDAETNRIIYHVDTSSRQSTFKIGVSLNDITDTICCEPRNEFDVQFIKSISVFEDKESFDLMISLED